MSAFWQPVLQAVTRFVDAMSVTRVSVDEAGNAVVVAIPLGQMLVNRFAAGCLIVLATVIGLQPFGDEDMVNQLITELVGLAARL